MPDLEAALTWYRERLDFRFTGSTVAAGLTWAFIAPPNDDSFQIELAAGPGAEDRRGAGNLHDSLEVHGWHHVCLRVDNVDEALEVLRNRGVEIVGGPMEVAEIQRRFAFFSDPWGNIFELTQPLNP